MTTWVTIPNGDIDQDSPVTQPLMTALRDNVPATAEGATGAPVLSAAWHPYNMVNVGDGNDGVFYDFSVDGAVASVETPNFEDGYEYLIIFEGVSHNSGINRAIQIDQYFETAGAYRGVATISVSFASGDDLHGAVEFFRPRATEKRHFYRYYTSATTLSVIAVNSGFSGNYHGTAQKVLKAKVIPDGTGSFDAGKMYLLRRRALA